MPDTDAVAVPSPATLQQVLSQAREAGFLGPGPLDLQHRHALGFAQLARGLSPAHSSPRLLDLGSGGGLPGLVVALEWPEATLVLLDANRRRTDFLAQAVKALDLTGRVTVLNGRAEMVGRSTEHRGAYDGILARSFGPPAAAAECAAPLLSSGGWLVVSEPPDRSPTPEGGRERWPAGPLIELGLRPAELIEGEFGYQVLRQEGPCPERFPRRNGMPANRPLF